MLHDGSGAVLPTVHPYVLDTLETPADFADVKAFLLCMDTEVPPTVGLTRTLDAASAADAAIAADLTVLEQQSLLFASEVAVQGVIGGRRRAYFFDVGTQLYRTDVAGEPGLTRAALLAQLSGNGTLTFMGVPYGRGSRLGGDRDTDAILDGNEPLPRLTATRLGTNARLQWPVSPAGWALESAPHLDGPWTPVTRASSVSGANTILDDPIGLATARFYRLRRTW
jgi:hypothetical protein